MWVLIGLGAIGAGLYFGLRDFVPWLRARRSGVLHTKGLRSQPVERTQEPERFDTLLGKRLQSALTGLAIAAGGLAWLLWNGLSLWMMQQA